MALLTKAKRKRIMKKIVLIFYSILFHLLTTKKNVILFESSNGTNYTGNPKYIYEYLLKNHNDEFKFVWSLTDKSIEILGNPIKVKKNRLMYFYYTIISGFWIFDSRHPKHLLKKEKCKYIQTWHGTPLKKLGLDMDYLNMGGNTNIERYKKNFKDNSSKWDYLISQNHFSSKIFKRAFDFKGTVLEIGYPRNDLLIHQKDNIKLIEKIKESFNIPLDKKVILYAPTWRDNDFYRKGKYKFSTEMDFEAMERELSDEYVLIAKQHYLVSEKSKYNAYSGVIRMFDSKSEIQDLYLISDILITDYSSVMFDYSILKRPMIFYTYDLEAYKDNIRDFYFDINEEAPGLIIRENKELIKVLKDFDENKYLKSFEEKYKKFNEKYNQYDDGNASKKIYDLIKNSEKKASKK